MPIHTIIRPFLVLAVFTVLLNGCKEEENPAIPPAADEHAPPTTMIVVLKEAGKIDSTKSLVRDTTVIKGKAMVEDTLRIASGITYAGYIVLYDESQTPVENATQEIVDDQDNHLFVFTPGGGANGRVTVSNLSKDSKGSDFGLTFSVTVSGTGAASGTLQVRLRHYGGNPKTSATYDTDIDQTFPVVIR